VLICNFTLRITYCIVNVFSWKDLEMNLKYQKKVCNDVNEICAPLFKHFKINFFSHTRALYNGGFAALMTLPELTEYYIDKKYPIRFSYGQGIYLEQGFYLNVTSEDQAAASGMLLDLKENFNTANFFYIVEKNKSYDDFYAFATTPENQSIYNHYLNNLDLINLFLLHYKSKAKNLISKAAPLFYNSDSFAMQQITDQKKIEREACKESLSLKKITVCGHLGEVVISKRELDCIKYLIKSYSYKEIAQALNLSPRTVETYINSLKDKLGCANKWELIELVLSLQLLCL